MSQPTWRRAARTATRTRTASAALTVTTPGVAGCTDVTPAPPPSTSPIANSTA